MTPQAHLLPSYFNPYLVVLSIIVAILASYTALDLASRVTISSGRFRRGWLIGGSVAMGTGIWSMHFIGMLAFSLPMLVRYDIPTVVVSHVAAVAASGVALFVVSRQVFGNGPFISGGILMGFGITAMHYLGMAAMRLPATVHFDLTLVALSVLIAIGASFIGLWIAFHLRADARNVEIGKKIGGAVVMGGAIPAMHYVGMAAASFEATNAVVAASPFAVDISILGGSALTVGTFLILGLTLLTSIVDRRLTAQTEEIHRANEQLRVEIGERTRVENELRKTQGELENWVLERTLDLSETNKRLKNEIVEREKAQQEIESLAKFPDENPYPILRISTEGNILYKNKASALLLNESGIGDDTRITGISYEAAQKAFTWNQPVQTEIECGTRTFSITFAPVVQSHYLNVYALDITARKEVERESHRLMNNLGERVKELTALHQASKLVQDPTTHPKDIIENFIHLLPPAWRYPEDTAAHFVYDDLDVGTANFSVTQWVQRAEFTTGDRKQGVLEVCYLTEKPELDEGPFLKEEQNLINSLAEMLRVYFERRRVGHALELRSRFEDLIATLSTNFINLPTSLIDSGINDALRTIGQFAGVDRSYVFLISEDGVTMSNTHEWYVEELNPQKEHFQGIPIESIPWGMEQLRRFQPVHIPRVADLPSEANAEKALIWKFEQIQSLLVVPIVRRESAIGFLGFDAVFSEKSWDEDSVVLLRMVGEIFANALERKHAEGALQLNQFLMDRAGDMIFLVRSDARFCYVNEKACDSLGYSRDELLSMKVHDISLDHHSEAWQEHWDKTKRVPTTNFESNLREKTGKVFPAEVTVNFLEFNGVEYHCSFVRDITERKKAEEALRVAKEELEVRVQDRTKELSKANVLLTQEISERKRGEVALKQAERKYHSIVENAVEGIYQSSPDGRFISVNTSLARMYGYETPEELLTGVLDIEHQVYVDPTQREKFVHLLAAQGKLEGFECQVYHRDGSIRWISEYARAVKDKDGKLEYFEGSIQDITSRKQAEEELQRAKEIAESANRAKSEFLANMSHELRTPLNGILGYAQILKRDQTLGEAQKSGVDIMQRSGEHLLTLINDILDLSKIEAQKLEIQPQAFHLRDFLKSITDMTRVRAEQARLSFQYETASSLPAGVIGDEKRLRQVLLNLLGNAVKFTKTGKVVLRVSRDSSNLRDQCVRFEIEDSGIGIAQEHLDVIFKPFQQVSDRSRQVEGTGLGLAITKRLVTLMGGELHVNSTPGRGSTFWFTIDLPETDECFEYSDQEDRQIVGVRGAAKHVLVVDDKWENRAIVNNILSPLGFMVSEATNGREGLTKARECSPDVVLMDLVMPEMDGFEATQKLRQIPEVNEVVVIALSASVFEENQIKSREAGCDDFLPKPIQMGSLLEKLQTHLSLDWVYEGEAKTEAQSERIVAPPREELAVLFDAVQKGRIMAIREHVAQIEQLGPPYSQFATELRRLTQSFQMKRLSEFLQGYFEISK